MDKLIRIFTDGSAIGNPGPGGWGAVMVQDRKRWEMSGGVHWTTISEMELVAAIVPLRSLSCGTRVELRSDSEVLIRGMRFYVQRWESQGWKIGAENPSSTGIAGKSCVFWIPDFISDGVG